MNATEQIRIQKIKILQHNNNNSKAPNTSLSLELNLKMVYTGRNMLL